MQHRIFVVGADGDQGNPQPICKNPDREGRDDQHSTGRKRGELQIGEGNANGQNREEKVRAAADLGHFQNNLGQYNIVPV